MQSPKNCVLDVPDVPEHFIYFTISAVFPKLILVILEKRESRTGKGAKMGNIDDQR